MILPFVSIAEIREQFYVLKDVENEILEEFETIEELLQDEFIELETMIDEYCKVNYIDLEVDISKQLNQANININEFLNFMASAIEVFNEYEDDINEILDREYDADILAQILRKAYKVQPE